MWTLTRLRAASPREKTIQARVHQRRLPDFLHFLAPSGHLQGGPGRLQPAIVLSAQATRARLFLLVEHKDSVNDRNPLLDLNLGQGVRHSPADVLGVAGLALENDSQANDGRKGRQARLRELG